MTPNAFLNDLILFLNTYSSSVLVIAKRELMDLYYVLQHNCSNFQTSQTDNYFNWGGVCLHKVAYTLFC